MSSSLNIKQVDGGALVPVRVVPRASRTSVDGVHHGAIRIRLKSPPVEGAANKELCAFLAKSVGVPKSAVEITQGERSRSKTALIRGVTPADVIKSLLRTGGA